MPTLRRAVSGGSLHEPVLDGPIDAVIRNKRRWRALPAGPGVRKSFTVSDAPPRLWLPLKVKLGAGSVGIHGAAGMLVCFVYFDHGCAVRPSVCN